MTIGPQHIKPNGKVDLWFSGPAEPEKPIPPEAIDGIVHPADAEKYHAEVRAYRAKQAEYDAWGGEPVQVEFAAVDAVHALKVDPDHYSLDKPEPDDPEPAPEPDKPAENDESMASIPEAGAEKKDEPHDG